MTDYQYCNCNCGTKISLDEQLLNQRQQWKQKYFCLQKQTNKDIGLLKQKIYQECSSLMQNQFNRKQKQHSQQINKKNIDIQQLTSKIIKLESAYKVSEKQKEMLKQRLIQQEKLYNQKLQEITILKQKHVKAYNQLQQQNLSQTGLLKTKFIQENEQTSQKMITENNLLKDKIKQFQRKYLSMIPEVEKLRNSLIKKNEENQVLEHQLQKLRENRERENLESKEKLENAREIHVSCQPTIFKLNEKIAELENQLIKARNIKKQVKVQPVYVDRPVEVERVVEKIIQVERIVKEYIEPEIPVTYKQYEEENKRLSQQLNNIIHELQMFQTRYMQLMAQHDQTVVEFEQNIAKYKAERQNLVKRIHEQDEELEKIYNLMMLKQSEKCSSGQNEKIVVFVNKDGTYNKRVERIDIAEKVNVHTTVPNLRSKDAIINSKPSTSKQLANKSTKNIGLKKK